MQGNPETIGEKLLFFLRLYIFFALNLDLIWLYARNKVWLLVKVITLFISPRALQWLNGHCVVHLLAVTLGLCMQWVVPSPQWKQHRWRTSGCNPRCNQLIFLILTKDSSITRWLTEVMREKDSHFNEESILQLKEKMIQQLFFLHFQVCIALYSSVDFISQFSDSGGQ